MSTKTYSTQDILGSGQIDSIIASKNYSFALKNTALLHKPKISLKNAQHFVENLTYRKINDWDSKNLVSGSRNKNSAGWRRFSVVDIITLKIITDLRNFGLNTDNIRAILADINSYPTSRGAKLILFEYFIFDCLNGNKILLLIDSQNKVSFLSESDAIWAHFSLDSGSAPLIVLPFYSYVDSLNTKNSSVLTGELFHLTQQEEKILDIIRNGDYDRVTITKPSGEIIKIKATTRRQGNFSDKDVIKAINIKDYQCVTVSRVGGKKVEIKREETIKV